MPLDAYSPCPGGTGKKIKFCCPDFVTELQKIERMLEGEQHLGCLQYIEQLERQRADRPCLLAIKSMLLRATGKIEEAQSIAATFLDNHPENPVALAESSILAAMTGDGPLAMKALQRAMAASGTEISGRVFDAIVAVAQAMLSEGQYSAARALVVLRATIDNQDQEAVRMLSQLNRSPSVPLLMRDDRTLDQCPDDVPWKAAFDEALDHVNQAQWSAAAGKLAILAEEIPDSPLIWRNLAVLRMWLADTPGTVEALRQAAALDVPAEDAVEAEALAMCLLDDPLGDEQDVCTLSYEVEDTEQLETALASSTRVVPSPGDPRDLAEEDEPPPKAVYVLLDRPAPVSGKDLNLETMPNILALVGLFGRQTDRAPCLRVFRVVQREIDQVQAAMEELVGRGLRPNPAQKVDGHVSASWHLMGPRPWAPDDTPSKTLLELIDQRRVEMMLAGWPGMSLGMLDGKSPEEVAGEPKHHVKLSAAVMLLESWSSRNENPLDLNPLRGRLGLPVPGPIDPGQVEAQALPLARLSRVEAEKLSDEDLMRLYLRASAFGADEARTLFAGQLITRPALVGRPERLMAFSVLARSEQDPDRVLEYVEQGRTEAEAAGQSSASWDLLELSFRFEQGDIPGAMRLLQHVESEHIREPGVGEALTQMLVQFGLINPDGTPAAPPEAMQSAAAESPPEDEPGKLWTPEGQKPAEEKKLWMPGMD